MKIRRYLDPVPGMPDYYAVRGHKDFDPLHLLVAMPGHPALYGVSAATSDGYVSNVDLAYHDLVEHESPYDESFVGELRAIGAELYSRWGYLDRTSEWSEEFVFKNSIDSIVEFFTVDDATHSLPRPPRVKECDEYTEYLVGLVDPTLAPFIRAGWHAHAAKFPGWYDHQLSNLYSNLELALRDALRADDYWNPISVTYDTDTLEVTAHRFVSRATRIPPARRLY